MISMTEFRRSHPIDGRDLDQAPDRGMIAKGDGKSKRRWTINGDFLALKPNGVARHARETVMALDRLVCERHPLTVGLELQVISPRPADDAFNLRAIPVRVVDEFRRPRLPQFWVQMQLPFHVDGGLLSFCNLAPVAVRRQIVCIHDVHTYIMPESYGRGFRWMHRLVLPALGRRVRQIATVSRFSRDCIIEYNIADRSRISVVYNGADHALRWDDRASTADFIGRPFVLCLGQPQAYKNLQLALSLLPALEHMGIDLAIVGNVSEDYIAEQIGEKPSNLRLLGRLSDDDLAKAFTQALCFLFPSRIEGFGLPAVEAMARGCPVVASKAAAIPEICEDAALYCDADTPNEWIAAIGKLNQQPDTRAGRIKAGKALASSYQWSSVAQSYLQMMAAIDAEEAIGAGVV